MGTVVLPGGGWCWQQKQSIDCRKKYLSGYLRSPVGAYSNAWVSEVKLFFLFLRHPYLKLHDLFVVVVIVALFQLLVWCRVWILVGNAEVLVTFRVSISHSRVAYWPCEDFSGSVHFKVHTSLPKLWYAACVIALEPRDPQEVVIGKHICDHAITGLISAHGGAGDYTWGSESSTLTSRSLAKATCWRRTFLCSCFLSRCSIKESFNHCCWRGSEWSFSIQWTQAYM